MYHNAPVSPQGVMVRLMLVLAPVMCIMSGIAVSNTLSTYMKNLDSSRRDKKSKKAETSYPIKNEVRLDKAYGLLKLLILHKSRSSIWQYITIHPIQQKLYLAMNYNLSHSAEYKTMNIKSKFNVTAILRSE